ncbi:MAG TPA: aromatic ring-hydroxylating dioxygenase subunit alpha [Candidatus Binataceae bacterium]|nr:aromatic ring-hydroxylating dioxygenase subunit alpha [Candidatus Binataceae bacterium]
MDIESLIAEDPARETFRVHRSVMTSPEIYELERKLVFGRSWLYIGHESEIEKPGDFRRREVAGRPLIFIRGKDGVVRVFFNTCTHWGAKVCRLDQGNATSFQCFYHAWTFNNLGQLIAIPDAGGYPENFNRAELALKSPPHVDNYRGLYFVNLDPDAQPLINYLDGARDYMDLILDQSEAGWRVVAGTQMYTVRANWKLMATNSLDTYHAPPLHTTYFSYMAKFKGLDQQSEADSFGIRAGGHGRSLGNGHGVGESAPSGVARPIAHWHPMFGEAARGEINRVRQRIFERFGPERAGQMCDTFRLFLIYPNFVFHDVMAITLRYFEPVGPDAVRLTVYALAPKDESQEQLERRLNNFVSFLGPGGFAHPDDLEAIESCQDGFRSEAVEWSDFSKGMNRDPEVMDELPMRAFWRQWQAQMLGRERAARFDDLKFAGNGVAAAGK